MTLVKNTAIKKKVSYHKYILPNKCLFHYIISKNILSYTKEKVYNIKEIILFTFYTKDRGDRLSE